MKKITFMIKQHYEMIAYLFWGGCTTIISWGSYSLFVLLFAGSDTTIQFFGTQATWSVWIANILSWLCAVIFAFITNKIWVFRSRSWKPVVALTELVKFVSTRLLTGVMEMLAVPLLVGLGLRQTFLGIEGMIAKIIVSILVVILNYIFGKLLVFNRVKQQESH